MLVQDMRGSSVVFPTSKYLTGSSEPSYRARLTDQGCLQPLYPGYPVPGQSVVQANLSLYAMGQKEFLASIWEQCPTGSD